MSKKTEEYNGYKNYETWNVALFINNDEACYNYAKHFKNLGYLAFRRDLAKNMVGLAIASQTPDGVNWNDPALDIEALDALLADL